MNRSLDYYRELANRANLEINVPAAHKTLFKAGVYTEECLKRYYYDQLSKKHGESLAPCANDDVCKYCKEFHVKTLKEIDKSSDIELGNNLEKCFRDYFEQKLNSQGIGIRCLRADNDNLHMPDFKIVRVSDQKEIAFFEFKVILRPFIYISKVNSNYLCYSHSLTLDLSNGKKLHKQRKLVEDNIGTSNTVYVYWYDLPCVKGVFWMRSERVYQIMDEQIEYDRKHVAGDYNNKGKKVGSTKKLYLPLLEMHDFKDLLNYYYKLAKNP